MGRIEDAFRAQHAASRAVPGSWPTSPPAIRVWRPRRDILLALERGGADVIEVGVPFSDPIADGPSIQRATERALAAGGNLGRTLDLIADVRETVSAPIVLFTYVNPVLRMGTGGVRRSRGRGRRRRRAAAGSADRRIGADASGVGARAAWTRSFS